MMTHAATTGRLIRKIEWRSLSLQLIDGQRHPPNYRRSSLALQRHTGIGLLGRRTGQYIGRYWIVLLLGDISNFVTLNMIPIRQQSASSTCLLSTIIVIIINQFIIKFWGFTWYSVVYISLQINTLLWYTPVLVRERSALSDPYCQSTWYSVGVCVCMSEFLNNSVKHWPTLIIFGVLHHEETWHKWL